MFYHFLVKLAQYCPFTHSAFNTQQSMGNQIQITTSGRKPYHWARYITCVEFIIFWLGRKQSFWSWEIPYSFLYKKDAQPSSNPSLVWWRTKRKLCSSLKENGWEKLANPSLFPFPYHGFCPIQDFIGYLSCMLQVKGEVSIYVKFAKVSSHP